MTITLKVGDKVRVTYFTYGEAVYGRKGEILNANQRPDESVYEGVIETLEPECKNGAIAARGRITKGICQRFSFYPNKPPKEQLVEVLS